MALSLGAHPGMIIQVGESTIKVLEVLRGQAIRVSGLGGVEFMITDQQRTEVFPQVFLSYGSPNPDLDQFRGARLAIEAPRSMKITRLHSAAF